MNSDGWDKRYSEHDAPYGLAPNDYLRSVADRLPQRGRVLCLAEGDGRNALFLASRGHVVTALDFSPVALRKIEERARAAGVEITTVTADLTDYAIEPNTWDAIVSIWCHVPGDVRARLHREVVAALRPNGALVIEAYRPEQLAHRTGGPPTTDRTYAPEALRTELAGLEIVEMNAIEREIHEGVFHNGHSAVLQLFAVKPA